MNDQLQRALQGCSLHGLLMVTTHALARSGFGDIEILDRRTSGQKSRYGGHELLCRTRVGMLPVKLIIKVVSGHGIRLRHLDEIAGAVDRTGADIGIVLSPFPLSGGALENRGKYSKSRIEVFDGPVLSDLFVRAGLGVTRGAVDYTFFRNLESLSPRVLAFIKENAA